LSIAKSEEIKEIEELITRGEYEKASEKIDIILQNNERSKTDRIRATILKCEINLWFILIQNREYLIDTGLSYAEEALKEAEEIENNSLIFDALVWRNIFLYILGKYEEYLEGITQLEKLIPRIESQDLSDLKLKEFYLLFCKALAPSIYVLIEEDYKININEIIEILEKASRIARDLDNKKWFSFVQMQTAFYYRVMGNLEKAKELHKEALELAEELGNDYSKAVYLVDSANDYLAEGEYKIPQEYLREYIKISEKKDNRDMKAAGENMLGQCQLILGNYDEALVYFLEYQKFLQEYGERPPEIWFRHIASTYLNLGEIEKAVEKYQELINMKEEKGVSTTYLLGDLANLYTHKGDLNKAIDLCEKAIDYYTRTGEERSIAFYTKQLSKVCEKKGIINKALEYLEKAEEIYLKFDNKVYLTEIYYNFIVLTTNNNEIDMAKKYFKKLEDVVKEIDHRSIKRLILVSEGLILKHSENSNDRIRAEVLFDQLLQEDLKYEYKVEILLQLSELLLSELRLTSNERYLEKLQKTVELLIEIGTESNSSLIIVESLWFKAQLCLLNLDIEKARELLTQALDIAERKGMNQLALKVMKSKENLIKQKIELETLEETSPTISNRMDIIRVENGFKELKSKEVFEFKVSEVESSKKLFSLQI
jgi:tetratricopeptide (TPR) repeat protein